MVAQAWAKHESDRIRVSKEPSSKIKQILVAEFEAETRSFLDGEVFVQHVDVAERQTVADSPLLTEVYTTAQNVMREAERRGHRVGTPMSLENGFNFLDPEHRKRAKEIIQKEKPFCLVVAFPCGPFSPLQRLNTRALHTLPQRREEGRILMKFGIELAELQISEGRRCILENPLPSAAWQEPEMRKFLEENEIDLAVFDQCRFHLRNAEGVFHKKPTQMAMTCSKAVRRLDGVRCMRNHDHAPVIGGSKITARAGIYPKALARALVLGVEDQFEHDHGRHETLAAELEEDEGIDFGGGSGLLNVQEEDISDDEAQIQSEGDLKIPAHVKAAVMKLHNNTGHRSGKRLARALAIAGAPGEAVRAARHLKCALCHEKSPPKARRPASLPTPKDLGDQVHIDIFESEDAAEKRFYVVHATDWATRFQAAEVLPDKSTKSVVRFLATRWLPTFGAPRVLVCDQGREFVSWEMEEWASSVSTMLHHIAVQAPWQNGVAERSGGVLKTLLSAVVVSQSVIGMEEMQLALAEAVAAYNGDVNELGVSPFQAAVGKQPRMIGDVLGGISSRLAEHGLIDSKPSFARQIAMREVAKVAMTRLHFSRGLRKAELARSRTPTLEQVPEPGAICYFYRPLRYNNKTSPSKKRLTLKRWHGPALLVATEGHSSAFLSYKGQLTKCAMEHVRCASTMEQIAAETWRDAIEEAVESAMHDVTLRGIQDAPQPGQEPREERAENPPTPGFLPSAMPSTPGVASEVPLGDAGASSLQPGDDLPPVQPQEIVGALGGGVPSVPSLVGASSMSRRASDVTLDTGVSMHEGRTSRSSRPLLERSLQQAQQLDEASGVKRPAEVEPEVLRESADVARRREELPAGDGSRVMDVLTIDKEGVLASLGDPSAHPLMHVYHGACLDRSDPLGSQVEDHGSWHGQWPLPSRSEWQVRSRLGLTWPTGQGEINESRALAVQAARKEYFWKNMSDSDKVEYGKAAEQAWSVWAENDAVEALTKEESAKVRARLDMAKENRKILTPRYVFTDKHDGLRTSSNPLPLKARARIVVPGFKDVLSFSIRKDAPTASRVSQHMLLIWTASHNKFVKGQDKAWRLVSADRAIPTWLVSENSTWRTSRASLVSLTCRFPILSRSERESLVLQMPRGSGTYG